MVLMRTWYGAASMLFVEVTREMSRDAGHRHGGVGTLAAAFQAYDAGQAACCRCSVVALCRSNLHQRHARLHALWTFCYSDLGCFTMQGSE